VTLSRRRFLQTGLAVGAGLTLITPSLRAIEPIKRAGSPHMRLGLAGYSCRKYLTSADKTKKPEWTYDDFIDFAAEQNVDAVELTAYYFPEVTPEYLARIKGKCIRLGLDINGSAVGNNFCVSDADKLKAEIASVKTWIEHTARLGGKTLRIFAGKMEKDDTEVKARERCVPAIQEACDHAAKFGVYLALENHGGITETPEQLLSIVKAVKHDWFGVNLDTGNFHGTDPYADLAALAPYAVNVQLKTEITRAGQKKEDADLKKLVTLLRNANYRGYVVLEYEAQEEPKTAIPRHLADLRKLINA
jgi:sugar phosphate isomerase/epimerase